MALFKFRAGDAALTTAYLMLHLNISCIAKEQ